MRKSRFSDEQVVAILREADREPMAAVAKRHGVKEWLGTGAWPIQSSGT